MKNIIMITLISLITVFLSVNTINVFAVNNASPIETSELQYDEDKIINQENYQNNQCRDDAKCDNQSLEQLNNQNNQCRDDAKCINESVSNIFVCEERSLCLIQYEGPFELLNPY